MKKIILLGICIVVPFIGGCNPSAPSSVSMLNHGGSGGEFVEYRVDFNAAGPSPMQTPTANRNCTKGVVPRKGCMKFEKDTYGVIVFGLVGAQDNKKCSDTGVQWVITKVELSDSGNINTSKGSNFGSPVAPWVQKSFFGVKPLTGVIYDETWSTGRTSVALIDLNNNIGAKDLWYRVTAAKCTGTHATNTSDPRIENIGK